MKYIIMLFLIVSMVYDIREKKIPALWIWGSILIMVVYRFHMWWNGECTALEVMLAFIPGLLLYIFSRISSEIGNGDGLLIIATGCFFSWEEHLKVLFFAFFLAAFFSMGTIIFKRDFKNRRIPFIPFLCSAAAIIIYVQ